MRSQMRHSIPLREPFRTALMSGFSWSSYWASQTAPAVPTEMLDGNSIWFDMLDKTKITKNVSDQIESITDKYSLGYSLNQATDSKKPIDFYDGITFDSAGEQILLSNTFGSLSQPLMVYALVRKDNWVSSAHLWASKTPLYYSMNIKEIDDGGHTFDIIAGSAWKCRNANPHFGVNTTPECIIARYAGVDSYSKIRLVKGLTENPGTAGITSFEIGGSSGYSSYSSCKYAGFLLRPANDSEATQALIYEYLVAYYAWQMKFNTPKLLLSFDNNSVTWYNTGFPLFESLGVKGTWYTNGATVGIGGITWAQLVEMSNAGHSIQDHTWDHPDLTLLSEAEVYAEMDDNSNAFVANGLPAPEHFAYPAGTGASSETIRGYIATRRLTARDYSPDYTRYFNTFKNTMPFYLPAFRIDDTGGFVLQDFMDAMADCKLRRGAIQGMGHSIGDAGGTQVDALTTIINYAKANGFQIITANELSLLLD